MRLSVLEQSTLSEGGTASQAIQNTVTLAKELDSLRFDRLWVSEHHNMSILQGSAPEVLLASIGAQTRRIRIGSGGVMLPNHSAYHIAEAFRMLEALYPGRVDCGIGRASGGDSYSRSLLNPVPGADGDFPTQVERLDRFFHDECRRAIAMPDVASVPPIWLLSAASHVASGDLAAEKGLGLVVALFINPDAAVEAVQRYRERFIPSREFTKPYVMIAVNAACAATEGKLLEMKKTSDFFRLMRDSGRYPASLPSPQTLGSFTPGPVEADYLQQISNREVIGLPAAIHRLILDRALKYEADEVMLTTMAYSLADKIESFRLIAEQFSL